MLIGIIVLIVIVLIVGLIIFAVARGTGQTLLDAAGMTAKFGATPSAPEASHP